MPRDQVRAEVQDLHRGQFAKLRWHRPLYTVPRQGQFTQVREIAQLTRQGARRAIKIAVREANCDDSPLAWRR